MHSMNLALMPLLRGGGEKSLKLPFTMPGPGMCFLCGKEIPTHSRGIWSRRLGAAHVDCFRNPDEARRRAGVSPTVDMAAVERRVNETITLRIEDEITKVEETMKASIVGLVDTAVAKRIKPATIEVAQYRSPRVTIKHPHMRFEELTYLVSRSQNCYLWGPPGSLKSTSAYQVAKALKRKFYYVSLTNTTERSILFGFMQPQLSGPAKYVPTDLYRAYTEGGVFCIDEMDNGPASLLASLNSLLENLEFGSFPIGMVERHKDFIVVGTGNTTGRGANPMYPERRVFDAAFAGRFVYLEWLYDEAQERNIALEINGKGGVWVDWMHAARAWAKTNDQKLVVSPRETFKMVSLVNDGKMTVDALIEAIVFKGAEGARKSRLLAACPLPVAA